MSEAGLSLERVISALPKSPNVARWAAAVRSLSIRPPDEVVAELDSLQGRMTAAWAKAFPERAREIRLAVERDHERLRERVTRSAWERNVSSDVRWRIAREAGIPWLSGLYLGAEGALAREEEKP